MAASLWQVRDELWEVVGPLVPVHEPDPRGGRPRVDVNGHRFLPSGGHRFSPLAAMFSPRWWQRVLPG